MVPDFLQNFQYFSSIELAIKWTRIRSHMTTQIHRSEYVTMRHLGLELPFNGVLPFRGAQEELFYSKAQSGYLMVKQLI